MGREHSHDHTIFTGPLALKSPPRRLYCSAVDDALLPHTPSPFVARNGCKSPSGESGWSVADDTGTLDEKVNDADDFTEDFRLVPADAASSDTASRGGFGQVES